MAAQKPDGKDPGQRVSFTRQGADRIARAVRTVEQGDRKASPLQFDRRWPTPSQSSSQQQNVITGVEITDEALIFTRAIVAVLSTATAVSISIPIEQCPFVEVSAEGQAFFYG